MVRSLWTAATGMISQQYQIDTISNNLANVNTTGFKKNRVDFEDLIYQHHMLAGTPATSVTERPTGVNVGHGVKPSATPKDFSMGSLQSTGRKLDIAVSNSVGFFKVTMPDGSPAYTRDGAFKMDSNRQILTSNGYLLTPSLTLPLESSIDTLAISGQGEVTINDENNNPIAVGQIELYRFLNQEGLKPIGKNLFQTTSASGTGIPGIPGIDGFGSVEQGFLEMSNVHLANEMVNMIVAQRAYESNSKSIQTSDSMLATAIQLKR